MKVWLCLESAAEINTREIWYTSCNVASPSMFTVPITPLSKLPRLFVSSLPASVRFEIKAWFLLFLMEEKTT